MSILAHLYAHDFDTQTSRLINTFEHYAAHLLEKVQIIVDIYAKFYDIKHARMGFIREDELRFSKRSPQGSIIHDQKNRSLWYFKGWVNRRLKRIQRIMRLEVRENHTTLELEHSAVTCAEAIANKLAQSEEHRELHELFCALTRTLLLQERELSQIYPLKNWTLEAHGQLLSDTFMKAIRSEIQLVTGKQITTTGCTTYPGIIITAFREHKLPAEGIIQHLIEKNNAYAASNLGPEVRCYHARPIFNNAPLFPLRIKHRETGFFFDTNLQETIAIIRHLYDLRDNDLVCYEIIMPLKVFQRAMRDTNSEHEFKGNASLTHAYVIRPSDYSYVNMMYAKNLIKVKMLRPSSTQNRKVYKEPVAL